MRILYLTLNHPITNAKIDTWKDLFRNIGGAEKVVWRTASISATGNDVTFLNFAPQENEVILDGVKIKFIRTTRLLSFIDKLFFKKREIINVCKEINPDIIHSHVPNIIAYHLRNYPAVKIQTFHNSEYKTQGSFFSFIKINIVLAYIFPIVKKFDQITTTSKRMQKYFEDLFKRKLEVIPNGVDCNLFKPSSRVTREKNLIVFVGKKEKGLRHILDLACSLPNYSFVIFGPITTNDAKSESSLLGIPENIELRGFVDSKTLCEWYNKSTYCVFPSKYDNFPLVGLEAMACGAIVIAGHRGFKEYIDQRNGFTLRNIDSTKIKKVIQSLDKIYNKNIIRKNAIRTAQSYSWEKSIKAYEKIYSNLDNS